MKKLNDCPLCKCEIWIPESLFNEAIRSVEIVFYCAYGHKQHFSQAGIDKYWTKPVTKNQNPNNVFPLFKAKGHEAQPNP